MMYGRSSPASGGRIFHSGLFELRLNNVPLPSGLIGVGLFDKRNKPFAFISA